MWAILSDIHANLEAFQAVLADIDSRRGTVERILCLGDTVGYGPDPVACLDLVRERCDVVLLGNHDLAVVSDDGLDGWGARAAVMAIFRTREELARNPDPPTGRRWDFLAGRPLRHYEGRFLYVHGSPHTPLNEYVFPEDIYNPRKMQRLFALVEHVCFHGHMHIPGVLTETGTVDAKTGVELPAGARGEVAPQGAFSPGARWNYLSPPEMDFTYALDHRKALVNVGSVGQPRDGDPRACYALFDGKLVRFRRVPYDIDTTVGKVYDNPDLDNYLGDRLREGR
jgi:diadenosine tetraphosphatase ApaH/serine/threonine PP2A family protein phosphatase